MSFPPRPIPEGMLSRSFGVPSRRDGPPSIWDTHGISGNVFANPVASSSAPYSQELNHWNSSTEEPLLSSTVEKSERQEQNQDLRCQSGPSAKNSVIFSGGDFKELWRRPTTIADFGSSPNSGSLESPLECYARLQCRPCFCCVTSRPSPHAKDW